MGVTTFTDEHTSSIHPARIFKASILDSHNLIPKLMPPAIKSIEIIQGNGGAESIEKINFAQGSNFNSVTYRIDELNEDTYTYNYTLIEGDALIDKLEKICYEVKFELAPNGGTISNVTSKYHTLGELIHAQSQRRGHQVRQGKSFGNVQGCGSVPCAKP